MEFEQLLADIIRASGRAKGSQYLEAKKEFADNCYPLIEGLARYFHERLTENEEVIAELIDVEDSQIQPDLAVKIAKALELGARLASIVELATPHLVNVEARTDATKLVNDFRQLTQEVLTEVSAVTVTDDEEEEEDEVEPDTDDDEIPDNVDDPANDNVADETEEDDE